MKAANHNPCPLCGNRQNDFYHQDQRRRYDRCRTCRLVFVPPAYYLSHEEEKAEYDRHQNHPDNPGYRQFLNRLFLPLQARLAPGSRGLDFGSGPGPTLSVMLAEAGHDVTLYDPFYAHQPAALTRCYDFITATEVVEHLRDPKREFASLFKMLKRGGWLGIMTKRVMDKHAFGQWHYIRDMTHICFYRQHTFEYLARRFDARLDIVGNDVMLLNKK